MFGLWNMIISAAQGGGLAAADGLKGSLLLSSVASILFINLLVVCFTKKGRTAVLHTVESTIVVALLAVLVAFVVFLPFGLLYLASKGVVFVAVSLVNTFPALKAQALQLLQQLDGGT